MPAAPRPHKAGHHLFARLIRRRRAWAHFARHPLQDLLASRQRLAGRHDPHGSQADELLVRLACASPEEALRLLHSRAQGLKAREAAARRARLGANIVQHEGPAVWPVHLWHCFADPFNLLLSALAAASALSEGLRAAGVILSIVCLGTVLRFVQERRSQRAAQALGALVASRASVLREAQAREIGMSQVVPGDLVLLSAGDMVPGDGRILAARDLFVAQSALTGESLPVQKSAQLRLPAAAPSAIGSGDPEAPCRPPAPLQADNLLFMGSSVVSGTATLLVAHTGAHTQLGAIAQRLQAQPPEPDALRRGLDGVARLLLRIAVVLVPLVAAVNGMVRGDWVEALMFALSVAVGLTPEMLPMVVTSTLATGALALSREQVVVKRLDAIHELGAMDLLCTDKTGTLTRDEVVLERHVDAWGRPSTCVLDLAFLNSHWQTGLRNLLDRAVLAHVERAQALRLEHAWTKLDEIPFDFDRRRMSVVVSHRAASTLLICKGAWQDVMSVCTHVLQPSDAGDAQPSAPGADTPGGPVPLALGEARPLQGAARDQALATVRSLQDEGLRVVAVALRQWTAPEPAQQLARRDEQGLTLAGFCAFLDPPKESAAPALAALASHGIAVKVLTGDDERVAAQVCRQVGLACLETITGEALAALPAGQRGAAVARAQLLARLSPLQKEEVVRLLRGQGHIVGFLGDGINDAPALRAADVGISVDSAADLAREAADVILLRKDLRVLDQGVITGRTTFCNLLKYIRMAASSNLGNVLSVVVASALLPFLPMLPLQLLVQNLLYDLSQTAIPFDRVDAAQVQRPLRWDPKQVRRFMFRFGPVSSLIDACAFALLWWGLGASSVRQQELFHTGWFIVGLLTQTLVVHLIRTPGLPGRGGGAAPALWWASLGVCAAGLWLANGPMSALLGFAPLPGIFYAGLALILAAYAVLVSAAKRLYVQRWGWP